MIFATYLYQEIFETVKPFEEINFEGYSFPHFNRIRQSLEKALDHYPKLPLRKADFALYHAVHNQTFLDDLMLLSQDKEPSTPLKCTVECAGMEFGIPGYCYSLGGLIEAIDQAMAGKLHRAYLFNVGGHHAHSHYAHGYSLLNTMAAAIRYGQEQGLGNVLIVDWDIHHGDGTQQIFDDDPTVHQISIHSAVDLYMLGASNIEQGTTTYAESVGHCNIPVLWDGYDDDFFKEIGLPGKFFRAAQIKQELRAALGRMPFSPDLIFIFSGYDGHKDDCGEGVTHYTNEDFRALTRIVLDYAASRKLPVISVHGGGYASPLSITINAALAHVEELVNYRSGVG
jgi:acetoin utilization deacetylase AcuC-like enzyme